MKYRVGDKVRIKTKESLLSDDNVDECDGRFHNSTSSYYMNKKMVDSCGKTLTVCDRFSRSYKLNGFTKSITWEPWMLEPAEQNVTEKVHNILKGVKV